MIDFEWAYEKKITSTKNIVYKNALKLWNKGKRIVLKTLSC